MALTPAAQTISFAPLTDVNFVVGANPITVTLSATATSALPVTFTSTTTPVCTVSGTTLSVLAPGACSITASQQGNAQYAAASPVTRTFSSVPTGNLSVFTPTP